ncbi:MAG: guanylate kinase [Methylococcales bacterium]|nr:guanylate kinase [Methylococcales bacterium]
MTQATLFSVSAPSGAGKTSLVRQLLAETDQLALSISHTTRAQRPGERHGEDYFFVSREAFSAMQEQNAFLEHAQVFDHCYGTAQSTVTDQLASGSDVLLEIDWQGARQVKQRCPDCVCIFILPPSIVELERRLRGRGQDTDAIIARRMRDARAEISHWPEYDYIVVNDDFATALADLKAIVQANRLRRSRQAVALAKLLQAMA